MPLIPTNKQTHIDPLNPPDNIICLSILQYATTKGQVIDVQCSLMKDLRNEELVMALLEEAKKALIIWYEEHKGRRAQVEKSQSEMEKR